MSTAGGSASEYVAGKELPALTAVNNASGKAATATQFRHQSLKGIGHRNVEN